MKKIRIFLGLVISSFSVVNSINIFDIPSNHSFFTTLFLGLLPMLAIFIGIPKSVMIDANKKFGEGSFYVLTSGPGFWIIIILILFRNTSYRDGLALLVNSVISLIIIYNLRNH
jgi:hypothetical protein